jgi:hypothetical protein
VPPRGRRERALVLKSERKHIGVALYLSPRRRSTEHPSATNSGTERPNKRLAWRRFEPLAGGLLQFQSVKAARWKIQADDPLIADQPEFAGPVAPEELEP